MMENSSHLFSASLDLMFLAWPTISNDAFLGDTEEVNKYTFKLARSKINELDSILTTSALLAGVVAAVHSWPSFDRSPWPAKTLFGASFILSLMSVRKAKQLNYILRRLAIDGSETEAGDKIRIQLAKKNSKGEWIASRGRQMIWNGSDLFLNFSIITMVLGYGWMILGAAVQVSWDWGEDDTKIAAALLTVGILAFTHWFIAGLMIYSQYKSPLAANSTTVTPPTPSLPKPASITDELLPCSAPLLMPPLDIPGLHHRNSSAKNDSNSVSSTPPGSHSPLSSHV